MKYLLLFSVLISASYCAEHTLPREKETKTGSYEAPFEVTVDGVTYYDETFEYGPDFMEEYWTPVDVMAIIYFRNFPSYQLNISRVICDKTIGDADVFISFNGDGFSPLIDTRFKLSDQSRFSTSDNYYDYHNIDGWIELTDCMHLEYGIYHIYQISGEFESSAVCSQTKDTVQVVGHFTDTRLKDRDEVLNYFLHHPDP